MTVWQAIYIAMVVLIDQVLDKVSSIAAWLQSHLEWSKRKSLNLAVVLAIGLGSAIYFWPAPATAKAPEIGEFEILGGQCTPDGGLQIVVDVTKAGLIGLEIPAAILRGCLRSSRI